MNKTLDEYQEGTATTAVYRNAPIPPLAYCALGLVGEIAEVFQAARVSSDLRVSQVRKELGDCFWYVSEAAFHLGSKYSEIAAVGDDPGCYQPLDVLGGKFANQVKKVFRDDGGELSSTRLPVLRDLLARIHWGLTAVATSVGLNVADVLTDNLDHLMRRSVAGTISGDGDNR